MFRVNALAAFDQSENGARRLKAAIDAIATESLRRAGTSLSELTTGFSADARAAVNDLDELAEALKDLKLTGDDAGRALAASLDKALAAASTERAVKAVEERFESLGKAGVISGEQMAAGLVKARQKADELRPGLNSLAESLRAFGLQTREELTATADRLGTAYREISGNVQVSLADQRRAFDQYAVAAIAANGGVESSVIRTARALLEMREAAIGAGKAGADAGAATKAGFDGAGLSIIAAAGNLDTFTEAAARARNAAQQAQTTADELARRARNDAALSGGSLEGLPAGANSRATTNTVGAQVGRQFIPAGAKYREPGNPSAGYYFPDAGPQGEVLTPQQTIAAEAARLAAIRVAPAPAPSPVPSPVPAPSPIMREVRVTIDVGGRSSSLYGSESEVGAFLRSIEEAKRSAGIGG